MFLELQLIYMLINFLMLLNYIKHMHLFLLNNNHHNKQFQ